MNEELPFSVERILNNLKDFQRDTVDYVFQQMYLDPNPRRRFLVADEVGLGKTLVARGVIARAVEQLWDSVERIDVVYICSNADIARQNINRLNIAAQNNFALASRITMLPVTVNELRNNRLNFISFTPGTSFDLQSRMGMSRERVLLYWMLDSAWDFNGKMAPLNILRGDASAQRFRHDVDMFLVDTISPELQEAFNSALNERPAIKEQFDALSQHFTRHDRRIKSNLLHTRSRLVSELRALLATTCLSALEPDLIILDEFQRFKYLLGGDSSAAELARGLFDYTDEHSQARVLLLSATPYKMYTLSQEEGEDHYEDFIQTLSFLQNNGEQTEDFQYLIQEYRHELYQISGSNYGRLLGLKNEIETRLRRVMVRTERLAVSEDRSGMLQEIRHNVSIEPGDIEAFAALQPIARELADEDMLEYWKSSPYLLNFMETYKVKKVLDEHLARTDAAHAFSKVLASGSSLIDWSAVIQYATVDSANGRMRWLLDSAAGDNMWRLLWMPPSMAYYQPTGPFADLDMGHLTKQLIFSSWHVVPRMISMLTSYEIERQIFTAFSQVSGEPPENTPEERRRRRPLLRFAQVDGRLSGMPVLGILYPSVTLMRLCDPLETSIQTAGELPTRDEMLVAVQSQIEPLLKDVIQRYATSETQDETWYWAAPILLDLISDNEQTEAWFRQTDLAVQWSSSEVEEDGDESLWDRHIEFAQKLVEERQLGQPPDDLLDVLAQMALAAPGVVALRSLARVSGGWSEVESLQVRNSAGRVAHGFRSLFNLPEATALIRSMDFREPYWRRVLEYGVSGNLQAVVDEYAHILREALGLLEDTPGENVDQMAEKMVEALSLRTVNLQVDSIQTTPDSQAVAIDSARMRTHFALRFGDNPSDNDGRATRSDQVRTAFNSPFWPFVLATTSVGQEGLDFHFYCHSVIHWNLPSNPVDLEQREGRVHRFKGHAIRKNLAVDLGERIMNEASREDPWKRLFDVAAAERDPGASDLTPFWIYQHGPARIERHVPMIPLSSDEERLTLLRRALVLYRMVFGQPRQEELVEYLLKQMTQSDLEPFLDKLRIDLSPVTETEYLD